MGCPPLGGGSPRAAGAARGRKGAPEHPSAPPPSTLHHPPSTIQPSFRGAGLGGGCPTITWASSPQEAKVQV